MTLFATRSDRRFAEKGVGAIRCETLSAASYGQTRPAPLPINRFDD